jgi:hypothetical protein
MSNPEAHPTSNRPSVSTTQQQAMPELTEGLVRALSSDGKWSGGAIVKAIETSTKFRSQDFNRATTKIPLTTLTCVDGSGQPITAKCASQLSSTAGVLVTGTVMKITKFQPVFFTLSAADRTKVALGGICIRNACIERSCRSDHASLLSRHGLRLDLCQLRHHADGHANLPMSTTACVRWLVAAGEDAAWPCSE